jgi:hypothetical protein
VYLMFRSNQPKQLPFCIFFAEGNVNMATQRAASNMERLSTELLQQIVVLLPCQSALSLVLCSRRLRDACDQIRIWRQIVQSTGEILLTGPTGRLKVAVADIKPHHIKYETELLQWLPQAIALYGESTHFVNNLYSNDQYFEPNFNCLV